MRFVRVGVAAGLLCYGAMASADVGVSLRAGTLGAGAELNVGLTETLNLRLGYAFFDHEDTIEDTDVTYDAELSLSNASALFDWHVFGGGFRLSFGAVGASTEIDIIGTPSANNTFEIGDEIFTAAEVGHLTGKIEMGNSVAPYIGFGWGNPVDKAGRVTLLLDIGAVYTGSPDVKLDVTCGASIPANRCNELRTEVQREQVEIAEEATVYEWWPVINLGFAVRF